MCCGNKPKLAIKSLCDKCGQPLEPSPHVCNQPAVAPPKRLVDKVPVTKPRKTIFLPY